ncbi:MAG TPA: hypothetical protein VHP11_02325, partial [Tepidisphaeraceae bacterium]|nr:hypothetical protein [Tepidisphaeraceae bacterium]
MAGRWYSLCTCSAMVAPAESRKSSQAAGEDPHMHTVLQRNIRSVADVRRQFERRKSVSDRL